MFARIGAAVSDGGGIMSHAAIVSREYGLPAVVATGIGTKVVHTGDRLRVNGNTGVVTILARAGISGGGSGGRMTGLHVAAAEAIGEQHVAVTENCRPEDLGEVGGKAVGLASLHRAGHGCPPPSSSPWPRTASTWAGSPGS